MVTRTEDPCPNCTGQQPAQPGSGEARRHLGTLYVGGSTSHYGSWYSATDYDRLQSAHEAAQRQIADLTTVLREVRKSREHWMQQQFEDQQRARSAEQRVTELEAEITDLCNRLNLSEQRQGRFPEDAIQPKEST